MAENKSNISSPNFCVPETCGKYNEVFIAGFVLTIPALVVGVYLLCKVKIELPNQRITLINRAICQILSCTHRSMVLLIKLVSKPGVAWLRIELFIDSLSFIVNRILTMHLIIDHILRIKFPVEYYTHFPEKAVIQIDGGLWIFGNMFALFILISANTIGIVQGVYKTMSLILLFMDIVIVILGVVLCVIKCNATDSKEDLSKSHNPSQGKFEKPCSAVKSWPVICSFVIFIFPSELMHVLGNYAPQYSKRQIVYYDMVLLLIILGYMVDAITYILLYKEIRKAFCLKLRMKDDITEQRIDIFEDVFYEYRRR